jgi:flagellar biosynthesis/type III secretory pathway protein FliH
MLTDVLEVHFLECRKFLKVPFNLQDPLHRWLRFLDQRTTPEQLKELMEMDAHMKSAEDMLYELMGDPEVRERYWQRRMAEHERASWQEEQEQSRKEIEDSQKEIEDSRKEIEDSRKEIEDAWKLIEEARKAIDEERAVGRSKSLPEGKAEAWEEGRQQGELKVKEIALNMLQANMDIALIEKFTGLKPPLIEELRKKL